MVTPSGIDPHTIQEFSDGSYICELPSGERVRVPQGGTVTKETKVFYCVIVGAALFGLLLAFHPWPAFHDLEFEKIGEALLIASFLAITVDQYSKRRLVKDIAQDVWSAIIGHPLPKEIQEYLKQLAHTHLLRRDWEIRYIFSYTDDKRKLNVRVESKFFLQNLSSSPQPYTQQLELEKHDNPRVLSLACDSTEKNGTYKRPEKANATTNLAKELDGNPGVMVAKGKPITISPNLNSPNITYEVSSIHEMEQPLIYSDAYSFGFPSLYVTVTAECPADLEVLISPEDIPERKSTVTSRTNRWQFRRLFVRGEHIRIRWFPKSPSATQQ